VNLRREGSVLVVDSSVWIDYFVDAPHPAVDALDGLLTSGDVRLVVPDLVLFEVLRGFRDEHQHRQARRLLQSLSIEAACDPALAMLAADHYRQLRSRGITVRSAIDVLVASFCIERDYALLHSDRDFEAFARHRGLRTWQH
jgi:predicted nucleic acid-binding protein